MDGYVTAFGNDLVTIGQANESRVCAKGKARCVHDLGVIDVGVRTMIRDLQQFSVPSSCAGANSASLDALEKLDGDLIQAIVAIESNSPDAGSLVDSVDTGFSAVKLASLPITADTPPCPLSTG
jgi:hypothetical protein